uniref:Udp-n-acetylmuramoyl-tripeptide--d-alanyl-d-alanine ligase n=1 Tax=Tetraselmis sp. GSL018 TaxID=582737 RepID=A0A061RRW0_9CHLO
MRVPRGARIWRFGASPRADVRLLGRPQTRWGPPGPRTGFALSLGGGAVLDVEVPGIGPHVAQNAACAATAALAVGVDPSAIARGLQRYQGPPLRMELQATGGLTVINDAYNANPASTSGAIQALADFPCGGRRVALLGDMLELGSASERAHRDVLSLCGALRIDIVGIVGEEFRSATERPGGCQAENFRLIRAKSPEDLAARVSPLLGTGDVVLLKGSRAMGMERIFQLLN